MPPSLHLPGRRNHVQLIARAWGSVQHPASRLCRGAAGVIILAVAVFSLALCPRSMVAPRLVTADEDTWLGLAANFAAALTRTDFEHTYQIGHPGVTAFWVTLAGTGLDRLERYVGLVQFTQHASIRRAAAREPTFLDDLAAARRAHAVVNALLVTGLTLLTLRLFGTGAALFAGGLLALDPFLVAHSQVIRMDSLQAGFVTLAVLAPAVVWTRGGHRAYLAFGGACLGLALLSKTSSALAVPAVLICALGHALRLARIRGRKAAAGILLTDGMVLAVAAGFTLLAGFPALWTAPLATIGRVIEYTVWSSRTPPQFGNFFLGEPVDTPPGWYYLVVLGFRATPAMLLGLALLALQRFRRSGWSATPALPLVALLTLVLTVLVALAPATKKADRYLLPAWPALLILAGYGLSLGLRLRPFPRIPFVVGGALLVAIQFAWLPPLRQYPLTYFNPMLGGLPAARRVLLVGWGEGLEEAANALNRLPAADTAVAATLYAEALRATFDGTSLPLARAAEADYLVDYINMEQRRLIPAEFSAYIASVEPLAVVSNDGVTLAAVYRLPRIEFGQALRIDRHLVESLQARRGERLAIEVRCAALDSDALSWTLRVELLDASGGPIARDDVAECARGTTARSQRLAIQLPTAPGVFTLALSVLDRHARPVPPSRVPPWVSAQGARAVFPSVTISVR